ncbi:MAG TPA: MBL fold metallo-hydrolase [Anaerolineales bacterium]|nr:MBL fold metallo-hydrolase [Anaerolineales bacterium]
MNIVNVGYRSTNYYAIDIREGKLLVDCGWPGTWPQLVAEFKRKSISATEIRYLLATHFHPDHAGLIEEFKQLGAELILLESQLPALQPPDPQILFPFVHVSSAGTRVLNFAGSRGFLASLGLAGEIIGTPGHSDDSVTLILDEGYAFTGDLPPRFMLSDEDTTTRASWDTIYRHKIAHIFPAHGNAINEMEHP